jgi:hypothetical protein
MTITQRLAAIAAAFLVSIAVTATAEAQDTQQPAKEPQQASVAPDSGCVPAAAAATDTARAQVAMRDSAPRSGAPCRNQSQSGVTSSAGASTLGPGLGKTTPDQSQPVKAKGDTLRKPADSARAPR